MIDTIKFQRGGITPELEDTLENVAGGVDFKKPCYGLETVPCPVCGGRIANDLTAEKVYCPECGRWFRFEGSTLVEVQP